MLASHAAIILGSTRDAGLQRFVGLVRWIAHTASSSASREASSTDDWRKHARSDFAIRPSLLSPLFSVHQTEQRRDARAKVVSQLLDAHNLLSNELDGFDTHQVVRTAKHRAASLMQLSKELSSLAARSVPATCTSPSDMLAYYKLLDDTLLRESHAQTSSDRVLDAAAPGAAAASAGNAIDLSDDDMQVYHDVASGKVPVWEAWTQHFAQRYAWTPSLEPLETIYAMHHEQQATAKLTNSSMSGTLQTAAAVTTAGNALKLGMSRVLKINTPRTHLQLLQKRGARMDISGTVVSEGRRKASYAQVFLKPTEPGQGRITVNNEPHDEYFRDISHRLAMLQPLMLLTKHMHGFNIDIQARGPGLSGQAQAARTAIARALRLYPGKLTAAARYHLPDIAKWDGRKSERKKPGRKKARAGFTYVRR